MTMDRIRLLRDYLEKSPRDSFLRHALALEYMKTGSDAEAIALWQALLTDDPDYSGSYYHLGKALEKVGEEDLAKEIYEKGISIANKLNENHARNELQQALDELL